LIHILYMSIFAWNVRGMNTPTKQSDILLMINAYKPSIVALIENKLNDENFEKFGLKLSRNWKAIHNNDCGCKGRIIVLWDSNIWTNININKDSQFIDCCFENVGGFNLQVTSVYGSNFDIERNALWHKLKALNLIYDLPWILLGDFNTVFHANEKFGGIKIPHNKLDRVNKFLLESGLIEPVISGNKYTWKSGIAKNIHCKLDRVLYNKDFLNKFPNNICSTLEQNLSDHTPLLVSLFINNDSATKAPPFRFKNSWVLEKDYKPLMEKCYNFACSGSNQYQFYSFLKFTKNNLKNWNKNILLNKNKIVCLKKEGKVLQMNADNNPADNNEINKFFLNQKELSNEMHKESVNARQKAKVDWLTVGDDCTKFFYAKMSSRKHLNNIGCIIDKEGNLTNAHDTVAENAINFYKDLYFSTNFNKNFPYITCKTILNHNASEILLAPVSIDEIKFIIFNAGDNKSPGPDGFNAKFYKNNWEYIKQQVLNVVTEFMNNGKILKSLNHTFITLIPKNKNPTGISDYRPISCCNFIYKIIASILSNRIKVFLPFLVSENQSAFVPGRLINENSLLAHEMVRKFNSKQGDNVCIKIDLQKAYDKVNRHFIHHIMKCMGFPKKFCDLVFECIDTPTFSILIQGKPEGFIKSNRGLRQGDPLSPYLFAIVMEYFSILMEIESIKGAVQPINRIQPSINHLIYADDLMVFVKANKDNAVSINSVFENLKKYAGLQLNVNKCKAYFSKYCKYKTEFLNILQIEEGFLPIKYLGLPLSTNVIKDSDCSTLIDKIQNRMETWSCKLLSIAGRLELIKTVIYAIILYWIQSFQIPATSIKKLESRCADFLWKGKYHKISWENVCRPKNEGGLGIRNIKDLCTTCHLKLFWRFLNSDSLWARWMRSKYLKHNNFWSTVYNSNQSNTWKHILNSRDIGKLLIERKFKNGKETSLWFDPWFKNETFINRVGWNSLVICGGSNNKVSDIIINNQWQPHIHPITNPHKDEICKIQIDAFAENDYWEWKANSRGKFSFKATWNFIRSKHPTEEWYNCIWNRVNCPKMAFCTYFAVRNRLPTWDKLNKWGNNLNSLCSLCNMCNEDSNHIFFECSYSVYIWNQIKATLNIDDNKHMDLLNIIKLINNMFRVKSKEMDFAHILLTTAVFNLWKERNLRVHNKNSRSKEQVWITIFSDSKIILQKSKKLVKNHKFTSLADDWCSEAGSKHLETYLLRSKIVQTEHNNKLNQDNSLCKYRDLVTTTVNKHIDIDNDRDTYLKHTLDANNVNLRVSSVNNGDYEKKLSDLGHNDTRSSKNPLDTSRFSRASVSHNICFSSNCNSQRGMRREMNEDLSYWERGETSGLKNGEETL
jgi:hypothetical protein